MAALVTLAAAPTHELPAWRLSVKAGRIRNIRTIEPSECSSYMDLVRIWRDLYSKSPYELSTGHYIASRMFFRIPTFYSNPYISGAVLVAEDDRGIAQALMRVSKESEGLFVEELLVAPWNNTQITGSKAKSKEAATDREELESLAWKHSVDVDDLTASTPASGTFMMYAACLYAQSLKVNRVALASLDASVPFYQAIGMKEEDKRTCKFCYDLSSGIPKELQSKATKHFPTFL